jgi:hypothetical protein
MNEDTCNPNLKRKRTIQNLKRVMSFRYVLIALILIDYYIDYFVFVSLILGEWATFSIIGCLPGKADPAIKRGGFGDTKVVVRIRHIFVPVPTRAWISSVVCCGLFSVICNYVSSIKFDGGHKKNKKKKEILNSFDGERQFPGSAFPGRQPIILNVVS